MKTLMKIIYLTYVKLMSKSIRKSKRGNKPYKITILMSFTEDIVPIMQHLQKENVLLEVFYNPRLDQTLSNETFSKNVTLNKYNFKNLFKIITSIQTSNKLIIDNYYLMLAAINKRTTLETIQIWHATSALKKFGTEDVSFPKKNALNVRIYNKVYDFTDTYVVAGSKMELIFKQSLNAYNKSFLRIGLPRLMHRKLYDKNGILFIPTYRDYKLAEEELLTSDDAFTFTLKSHPADINYQTNNNTQDVLELIKHASVVVTDYSSLFVDATYFGSKVMLFTPDEERYSNIRGLNDEYYKLPKENIAVTKEELIKKVKQLHNINIDEWIDYQTVDPITTIVNYVVKE